MSEEKQKKKISGKKAVLVSMAVDALDILMNATAATLTGSVVMLAETFQGIGGLISSSLAFVGMKRAKKHSTSEHPFGYGKELYFWTLLSSMVMFVVLAGLSFYFGVGQIFNPGAIEFVFLAFAVLGISVFTNGYSFFLSLNKLIDQESRFGFWKQFFRSDKSAIKTTFVLDLVGTLSAVGGLMALGLYQMTGDLRFDGIGAAVVGVFMAVFSIILFINAKELLVGKSISKEDRQKIYSAVLEFPEVKKILSLKATSWGSGEAMVYLEINARDDLVTDEIERLIDKIEKRVREVLPSAKHIWVEMEG